MPTNPLDEIVPARYRKAVYATIALLALIWTVYAAAGGNWQQFIGGLIVTLSHTVAASNTKDASSVNGQES